jgi:hypothetical protein
MLVFPTPDGPEMTMSFPFLRLLREVFKEGPALIRTEAPDRTVLCDTDFFEEALRAHLPHVRHRYDYRFDLRTCHKVIFLSFVKNVLKVETPTLEQMLDLCSYSSRLAGTFESGSPLFVSHLWKHTSSFSGHRINQGVIQV